MFVMFVEYLLCECIIFGECCVVFVFVVVVVCIGFWLEWCVCVFDLCVELV